MKTLKKLAVVLLFATVALVLYSCGTSKIKVQGITDDEIIVGNAATTSGRAGAVGIPFNQGIKAVFDRYNALDKSKRYAGGRKIKFVTYDDGFNAATGTALTEKLVEEDKVFALVGHFGTPTVTATIPYLKEKGVPMVYAATGANILYDEKDKGSNILPVQPIYKTDGRLIAARVINEALIGELSAQGVGSKLQKDDKVVVLYTGDEAGRGILEGVEREFELEKDKGVILEKVEIGKETISYSVAAQKAMDLKPKAIIVAANQEPFNLIVNALQDKSNKTPVFTSYVNADPTALTVNVNYGFNIFVGAWVDVVSDSGKTAVGDFVDAIKSSKELDEKTKLSLYTNAYATAGYIAAKTFLEGLKRLEGKEINYKNFIEVMESKPVEIPMGTPIDFKNGQRIGISTMALLNYKGAVEVPAGTPGSKVVTVKRNGADVEISVAAKFLPLRGFETIDQIKAK